MPEAVLDPSATTPGRDTRGTVPVVLIAVVLTALTAFVYWKALKFWYVEWTAEGSYYAHGVFIPFFVALMIWRDRARLRRLPMSRSWWGAAIIAIAIAAVLYGERTDSRISVSLSFVAYLIGSSLLVAGPRITRALLFPFVFLLTMIPLLPDQIIGRVAFPIQLTSATLSGALLKLIGFQAVRTGTVIRMDNYQLDVELPCSGFKTLVGLMAFAAAFAWLVEGEGWKRWTLFLSSVPLSVVVNTVRITLIGLVGEIISPAAAHTFHDYSGFIVLVLGFMVLFSMAHWLRCRRFLNWSLVEPPPGAQPDGPPRGSISGADGQAEAADPEAERHDALWGPPRTDTRRRLYAGAAPLLALMVVASAAKARVRPPAAAVPAIQSADIPQSIGDGLWTQIGVERGPDPFVVKELKPEVWVTRTYIRQGPQTSTLELLLNGGMSRHTFHDPHDCFPASGWGIRDAGVETIQTPVGPVQATVSEATDSDQHLTYLLMFFWVMDGKIVTRSSDFQLQLVLHSLLGDSGRPSYFLRFRQLHAGTEPARREELDSFIRSVWAAVGPKVATGVHPVADRAQSARAGTTP